MPRQSGPRVCGWIHCTPVLLRRQAHAARGPGHPTESLDWAPPLASGGPLAPARFLRLFSVSAYLSRLPTDCIHLPRTCPLIPSAPPNRPDGRPRRLLSSAHLPLLRSLCPLSYSVSAFLFPPQISSGPRFSSRNQSTGEDSPSEAPSPPAGTGSGGRETLRLVTHNRVGVPWLLVSRVSPAHCPLPFLVVK